MSHIDVVNYHGSLQVVMAVVYSGATAEQYDVNNAEPIGILPGSLAEQLNISHSLDIKENTQFLWRQHCFSLQLRYDK